ncbi:hypothetical protein D1871_10525, partial [Nakamurella silvestris]
MSIVKRPALILGLALSLAIPVQFVTTGPAVAEPAAAHALAAAPVPTVSALRTNSIENPLGIAGTAPLLSWQLSSAGRGVTQGRYEIHVASSEAGLAAPDVWNSGTVTSAQSLDVLYAGPALTSRTRYYWSVKVWDADGTASAWSAPAWFETAMLSTAEWTSSWIGVDSSFGPEWTNYSVDLDFTLKNAAFGVFLRSQTNGAAYMWQINLETAGQPKLRPHRRLPGGGYALIAEKNINVDLSLPHHLKLTVDGSTIITEIDGVEVDRRTDTNISTPGGIGFRTSGAESALIDNVKVTNKAGAVLLDTGFPVGDATFNGGTVTDGKLAISGGEIFQVRNAGAQLFRKDITLDPAKTVKSARIYAAAQGVYELSLNGHRVGDQELAPGWTDYRTRIQYQTYDVTNQVTGGANVLGASLAKGWFAGNLAIFGPNKYGSSTSVIAQLRVDYTDGSSAVLGTDGTWKTSNGPIVSADLLNGETFDGRTAAAQTGWNTAGFDASSWGTAVVTDAAPKARLQPQLDQPVRVTEHRTAKAINSPTAGVYLYDMGQNMVGKVALTLTGAAGQTAKIRYGEVLNQDGTLYTDNLRSAKVTDYYTFATGQPETYTPTFTFHGFRYVEISGVAAAPAASALTGLVMGTDGDLTSTLDSSSALVNQLHSNIVWGQRGNFLSIPTDTPARDERMGWTGDINVFARTAVYNMDSQAFLTKWLTDLRDSQRADGAFPSVSPLIPGSFDGGYGNAGWADAGVNVPYQLWQAYGDTGVIRQNYTAMTKYVDYLAATSTNFIRGGGSYNDWLNLSDDTPANVVGTAFVAKSARQLAEMAGVLGNTADQTKYQTLYSNIRTAFAAQFIAADGTVTGDSQTAYILALNNDLVPAAKADAVAAKFVATIVRRDVHLSTGFLGVDGLLPALTRIGRTDLAYRLLQNTDYPSWGYEIGKGATTIWERWNSIMPDGTFGPVDMNSFNHYAYGAVGEWMYETSAGVSALAPGFGQILIAPQPGKGITSLDYSHQTRYGTVKSSWNTGGDGFSLDVSVPANTTAKVRIPAKNVQAVFEGGLAAAKAAGVTGLVDDGDTVTVSVGSGDYHFAVDATASSIGSAVTAFESLNTLAAGSGISADQKSHIAQARTTAVTTLNAAVDLLATNRSGALDQVLGVVTDLTSLRTWLADEPLTVSQRTALAAGVDAVQSALFAAIGELTQVSVKVAVPAGDHLAGDTVPVTVTVGNGSDQVRTGTTAALTVPTGWTVSGGTAPADVPAGGAQDFVFQVTLPEGATVGDGVLDASVRFTLAGSAVTLTRSATLTVAPPLTVVSATADPASAAPGERTVVTLKLTNRSSAELAGTVVLAQDGWLTPLPLKTPRIGAGRSVEIALPVRVPLEGNAGPVSLNVLVKDDGQTLASAAVPFTVVQTLTPAGAIDYVDLGENVSETAHALTKGPESSTSVEAGRTRRYTGINKPNTWFEFDLGITVGKPFLVRVVETYDKPQIKDYNILINGTVVHPRYIVHPENGGLETFQFLVTDPALLTAAKVRVRFQHNASGTNWDPSIADVWSLPLTDAVLAPMVSAAVDPFRPDGENGWYTSAPTVTLAGQALSGAAVEDLDYRLGDGTFVDYTSPVTVSAEGSTTIGYRGTAGGLVSAEGTLTLKVDRTKPSTAAELAGAQTNTVTVTLGAGDAHSGVAGTEYRLGAGTWTAYTAPFTVTKATAAQVVSFRSTDKAGNVEATRTVTIGAKPIELVPSVTTMSVPAASASGDVSTTGVLKVTVTVTSTGTTPNGAVSILSGSKVVGAGTLTGGTATVFVAGLPAGVHQLVAHFPGDATLASSESAAKSVKVYFSDYKSG